MSKRKPKESQLILGTWHFWFLHIITVIGVLIGFLLGGWWGALAFGALMYASPHIAAAQFHLSKQDISRFYKLKRR